MSSVPFNEMLADAEKSRYAVGYFESWNMESLLAVADAAQAVGSPVILGFSGIYVPRPDRLAREHLSYYYRLGREVCDRISVPACLIFNESPYFDWCEQAVDLGFDMVMFTDEELPYEQQVARVRELVRAAHAASAAVEGEVDALAGISGGLSAAPESVRMTEPEAARSFVESTGVDALAINVGQAHLHGRGQIRLDLSTLAEIRSAVPAPLVLHGASSITQPDFEAAIKLGVRKVNVGSVLKQAFLKALRNSCASIPEVYNPYEVLGSGLKEDVLTAGRLAMQAVAEDYMRMFLSAGKA